MFGLDVMLKANFGKFSRKSRIIISETFHKKTYLFNIVSLPTKVNILCALTLSDSH